jgi:hypothetical protein
LTNGRKKAEKFEVKKQHFTDAISLAPRSAHLNAFHATLRSMATEVNLLLSGKKCEGEKPCSKLAQESQRKQISVLLRVTR